MSSRDGEYSLLVQGILRAVLTRRKRRDGRTEHSNERHDLRERGEWVEQEQMVKCAQAGRGKKWSSVYTDKRKIRDRLVGRELQNTLSKWAERGGSRGGKGRVEIPHRPGGPLYIPPCPYPPLGNQGGITPLDPEDGPGCPGGPGSGGGGSD